VLVRGRGGTEYCRPFGPRPYGQDWPARRQYGLYPQLRFFCARRTTSSSTSGETCGRPGLPRCRDPSNLRDTSCRYQPRVVSGWATAISFRALRRSRLPISVPLGTPSGLCDGPRQPRVAAAQRILDRRESHPPNPPLIQAAVVSCGAIYLGIAQGRKSVIAAAILRSGPRVAREYFDHTAAGNSEKSRTLSESPWLSAEGILGYDAGPGLPMVFKGGEAHEPVVRFKAGAAMPSASADGRRVRAARACDPDSIAAASRPPRRRG
jgi:hypothetical protein